MAVDVEWQKRSNCLDAPVDIFFPSMLGIGKKEKKARIDFAKIWCDGCPVIDKCLAFALDNDCMGVWGNTYFPENGTQRRILQRKIRAELLNADAA